MKQIKLLGVLALALTLGLAGCNKGNGNEGGESQQQQTSVEECKKHTWGEWQVVQEATCTVDGSQKRVCSVCGKEETKVIKAAHKFGNWETVTPSTCVVKGSAKRVCSVCQFEETKELELAEHTYAKDADGNDVVTWTSRADCENDGAGTKTCTVEGCGHVENVTETKLGHLYAKDDDGNDIVTWSKQATCTEGGVGTKTCTRQGCGHVENVEADPLGHDTELIGGETTPAAGEAAVRLYECKRCHDQFLGFKADEPSAASLPHLMVGDNGGMRFFGRPIGNSLALDAQGTSVNQQNNECVYCSTETGDFFEYIFTLNKAQADTLATCRLYCDARPADHMSGDFWAYGSSATDWTPGYYIDGADAHVQHNDDGTVKMVKDHARCVNASETDRSQAQGAELETEVPMGARITDYRYVLYVDDVIQQFDGDTKVAPKGSGVNMVRSEYVLPYTFHLHEGQNKISLRMAGGYRSEFYNFIFRPYVEPTPVTVNQTSLEIREGQTAQITSSMTGLTYKSSSNSVCTVDETGLVTGVKAGEATITVSKEGNFKDAKVAVTVLEKEGVITLNLADGVIAPEGGFEAYHSGSSGDWLRNPQKNATLTYTFQSTLAGKFDIQLGLRASSDIVLADNIAIKVNNVDVAVSGTVPNTNYSARDFIVGQANLVVGENTMVITALESSGLYLKTLKLIPAAEAPAHAHEWTDGTKVEKTAEASAYQNGTCACGAKRVLIDVASDLNGKITKRGGKLGAKNDVAKYVFPVPAEAVGKTAKLFFKGTVDNAGNYNYSYYYGKNGGSSAVQLPDNGTNTEVKFNNNPVTLPNATYSELGMTGTDEAGAATFLVNEVTLAASNELTLKRLDSFGIQYFEIFVVYE